MSDSGKHEKAEVGRNGEDLAVAFLESNGYLILDRNYRFLRGEIDIVCHIDLFIIFVEVKTRTSDRFGYPEEHIDSRQRSKLFEVAEAWLHERKMEGAPVRFDVISVLLKPDQKPVIKHFKNGLV